MSARRPKPPPHLGKEGRAFWRRINSAYVLESPHEFELLAMAAESLDRRAEARKAIEQNGLFIAGRYQGTERVNPAYALEKQAQASFVKAIQALNLDVTEDEPKRPVHPAQGDGRGLLWQLSEPSRPSSRSASWSF
jgi:hypothetical protein